MVQSEAIPEHEQDQFERLTKELTLRIEQGNLADIETIVTDTLGRMESAGHRLLLEGLKYAVRHEPDGAVERFFLASELLREVQVPKIDSIYSYLWMQGQLDLPRRKRPGNCRGYSFYKKNIAALQQVDGKLAEQVQKSVWPSDLVLMDFWDGLHLFSLVNQAMLGIDLNLQRQLEEHIGKREPITFGGIGSGWEIRYCLERQVDIIHGMSRGHYLFEQDPGSIRMFLHLRDWSEVLLSHELIIFGGASQQEQIDRIFGTLRYSPPSVIVGDSDVMQSVVNRINYKIISEVSPDKVRQYYASNEFRIRQQQIADGKLQPRILVDTCRWTTFLKYCAADFEKAFRQINCETRFLIEENDVQALSTNLHWRELEQFKPDVILMVSHARPTIGYLPRELPFIGYIQDKCGPIASLPKLDEHISRQDLFVCMVNKFQSYLIEKGVPPQQTFIMPIPADENMFYPAGEIEIEPRFITDAGYVKHGHACAEDMFNQFVRDRLEVVKNHDLKKGFISIFKELYRLSCVNVEKCCYEDEMQEFVQAKLSAQADEEIRHYLRQLVNIFHLTVYSGAWRFQFLEAFDKTKIELALYGQGWEENSRLKHLSRGPVQRDRELNYVYNGNRINLSINQASTMHQRLSECGLAGGFMMVADHRPEKDWAPVREYFQPDREIVLFNSRKELVDRCRYYLEHKKERLEIAHNMRQRALRERTCVEGAKTILEQWRKLLLQKYTHRV